MAPKKTSRQVPLSFFASRSSQQPPRFGTGAREAPKSEPPSSPAFFGLSCGIPEVLHKKRMRAIAAWSDDEGNSDADERKKETENRKPELPEGRPDKLSMCFSQRYSGTSRLSCDNRKVASPSPQTDVLQNNTSSFLDPEKHVPVAEVEDTLEAPSFSLGLGFDDINATEPPLPLTKDAFPLTGEEGREEQPSSVMAAHQKESCEDRRQENSSRDREFKRLRRKNGNRLKPQENSVSGNSASAFGGPVEAVDLLRCVVPDTEAQPMADFCKVSAKFVAGFRQQCTTDRESHQPAVQDSDQPLNHLVFDSKPDGIRTEDSHWQDPESDTAGLFSQARDPQWMPDTVDEIVSDSSSEEEADVAAHGALRMPKSGRHWLTPQGSRGIRNWMRQMKDSDFRAPLDADEAAVTPPSPAEAAAGDLGAVPGTTGTTHPVAAMPGEDLTGVDASGRGGTGVGWAGRAFDARHVVTISDEEEEGEDQWPVRRLPFDTWWALEEGEEGEEAVAGRVMRDNNEAERGGWEGGAESGRNGSPSVGGSAAGREGSRGSGNKPSACLPDGIGQGHVHAPGEGGEAPDWQGSSSSERDLLEEAWTGLPQRRNGPGPAEGGAGVGAAPQAAATAASTSQPPPSSNAPSSIAPTSNAPLSGARFEAWEQQVEGQALRELLQRRLPHLQFVTWLEREGDRNGEPVFIDYRRQFSISTAPHTAAAQAAPPPTPQTPHVSAVTPSAPSAAGGATGRATRPGGSKPLDLFSGAAHANSAGRSAGRGAAGGASSRVGPYGPRDANGAGGGAGWAAFDAEDDIVWGEGEEEGGGRGISAARKGQRKAGRRGGKGRAKGSAATGAKGYWMTSGGTKVYVAPSGQTLQGRAAYRQHLRDSGKKGTKKPIKRNQRKNYDTS